MTNLINHSCILDATLLHEFARTTSSHKAQVWKKATGGYVVVCFNATGDFPRAFVNYERSVDYALEWIKPY